MFLNRTPRDAFPLFLVLVRFKGQHGYPAKVSPRLRFEFRHGHGGAPEARDAGLPGWLRGGVPQREADRGGLGHAMGNPVGREVGDER